MWETKTPQELYKAFKTTTQYGGEKLICLPNPEHLLLNIDETGLMWCGLINSNQTLASFQHNYKSRKCKITASRGWKNSSVAKLLALQA